MAGKTAGEKYTPGGNPRSKNGAMRRRHRARLRAMRAPCGICGGEIHYDEPSDAAHPFSFVIDEIVPVSRYYLAGYPSREACAQDWHNLQAAHWICNARKGNRIKMPGGDSNKAGGIRSDGAW